MWLLDWFCGVGNIVVFAVILTRFGVVFDVGLGCGWFSFGFRLFGFGGDVFGCWLVMFVVSGCGIGALLGLELCGFVA